MNEAVALLWWLHAWLSVQAQDFQPHEQRHVKAVQACMAAVAKGEPSDDGDAVAPPVVMPSGDPVADAQWLIQRAAEGHVAGYGTVRVMFYDPARNLVILSHEVPRPPAQVLRLGVPLGGF